MTTAMQPTSRDVAPYRLPLYFPAGIPGLERYQRFTLIGIEGLPMYWLECDDEPLIALALAEAAAVDPTYAPDLPSAGEGGQGTDDRLLLVVLSLAPDGCSVTANLLAPIVVWRSTSTGRQVIQDGGRYSLRHPVSRPVAPHDSEESSQKGVSGCSS